MSGEAEGANPARFQAAFVFALGVDVLDLVAAAVAVLPCGGAVGNLLVGVEVLDVEDGWAVAASVEVGDV